MDQCILPFHDTFKANLGACQVHECHAPIPQGRDEGQETEGDVARGGG